MRVIRILGAMLLLLAANAPFHANDPSGAALLSGDELRLWPGPAPGSQNLLIEETITERSRDPKRHDRILTNILEPSLRVHRPTTPNGAAVIVAPGGGYQRIVIDKEGRDISDWLNDLGITAFVLKYRLPGEGHANPASTPLQDAQRAIRLVRSRAGELGIDPDRIGMIGFSAGGHLAGSLAAYHNRKIYEPLDDTDHHRANPDFLILAYAATSIEHVQPDVLERYPGLREVMSGYPLEGGPMETWPPTFMFQAADDGSVPVTGAIRLFESLIEAGVPAEIHVFRNGGHGFGIKEAEGPIATWPILCGTWMRHIGMLEPRP